ESLLAKEPQHEGLLLAAARGFTQYTWAFVQPDAERMESQSLARALEIRARAARLYRRARDYGLRALDLRHADFSAELGQRPCETVRAAEARDVPLLYWTAAAWGAELSLSKDDPETLAGQPAVEALIDRALALDEGFESGALHTFLVSYES